MSLKKSIKPVLLLVFTIILFVSFNTSINAQSSSSERSIYEVKADTSSIHQLNKDYSNVKILNQDLIDTHQPTLYESINSKKDFRNGSLLIVKDSEGKVITIIPIS